MSSRVFQQIEQGLVAIGRDIMAWRDDASVRGVLEPEAFKTVADLRAHESIAKLIHQYCPGSKIVSEEDADHAGKRDDAYWLIDPIDGTASWYGGFDGFVTQIAYLERGVPRYGAVYAPVLDKLWSASVGEGAWLNGVRLPALASSERLNLIDNYPEPRRIAATVAERMPISRYIECGSLGLKSALVADGTADLFIKDVVVRDWDIAPVAVMLGEVGGVMCDLAGAPMQFTGPYEKKGGLIVARDPSLAAAAVAAARE